MKIIITFLSLIVKRFLRSPSFGKDITIQIILGLIAVSSVGYFIILGFALEKIIINVLQQNNAIAFLNGLLAYYFIGEFILRYFVQSLPVLDVQPFLHLPIKRSRIVNAFLGISLLHVMTFFVFILFSAFALSAVARGYGIKQACLWLLSLWLISLMLHYAVVLLKLTSSKIEWKLFFVIVMCSVSAGADYFDWI